MPDALFHDPVHDGATDPTVIRHRDTGEWWMFYTQRRAGDETFGRHGDVVVEGDRATLYYFTHPHWDGSELGSSDATAARLSSVFAAPLRVVDDWLVCDREARPRGNLC